MSTVPMRTRRRLAGILAAAASGALLITGGPGAAQAASPATPAAAGTSYSAGRYIVQLADAPLAGYDGGVSGLRATRPAAGTKLDVQSAAAQAYRTYLTRKVDAVARSAKVKPQRVFSTAFNGFVATLSAAQAQQLAATKGVLAVTKDARRQLDTVKSPGYLGLKEPGGLWEQLGGTNPRTGAGSGVVVGVVDSGIWPENPAFAGPRVSVGADGSVQGIPGWTGVCETGDEFTAADCNKKLIGARYYVDGFGSGNVADEEFLSPRDGSGHGSHTAGTAAGNDGQRVVIDGNRIGTASGMAPAARIAVYKVCWEGKPGIPAGCFNSDSVAAIDQAVEDGVDVINFSISGTSANFLDPVEVSFLFAARAGVFVAASAGNAGPGASTVNHPSPWITTVAASTFAVNESTVELGNGAKYIGASITPGLPALTPTVLSSAVPLSGADPREASLCFPDTLDPVKAAGKVVVCDRGVVARIDKSFEVKRAGGVGMILVNTSPNSLNADYHPIPTVHLDDVKGAAVKAYVSGTAGATSRILAGVNVGSTTQRPEVAEFSSRGPSNGAGGDLLKPDISAPGVDVVAAVAPPSNHDRMWDYYSGTSMSSPHIAGLAALLRDAHPRWSPMMIKSALMTTARDHKSTRDPFAQGAGFVAPNKAVDPGLVFDAGWADWLQFLEGQCACIGTTPIDASDLNVPSIAIGDLAGSQTVTRTVTNVGGPERYTASKLGLPGVKVTVSPSSFWLARNATKTLTITLTRTSAPLGEYSTGFLRLTSARHSVRIPVAVRPVPLAAPAEVGGTGTSGSTDVTVMPGYTGTLNARAVGLAGATPQAGEVGVGPFDASNPVVQPGTVKYSVAVPAGSTLTRFDVDAADDTDDLDLYVYKDGALVDLSASGAADEQVTIVGPESGTYDVYVNGFTVHDADGLADFAFTPFVVGSADEGNLTVTPASTAVVGGTPTTFTAAWSGLDPAKRYLGWIGWDDGAGDVGVTIVSVS